MKRVRMIEALANYRLRRGNAFELVTSLDDGSVQVTVTSPPYNIGKAYERRTSLESYLEPYRSFAKQLFAKTRVGGSVCWQVGNHIHGSEVVPLDMPFYDIFREAGFVLRNRIIWHFEHGLHASKRFSGRYETILWFTKGDRYTFNLDPVRVPAKYPGKRHFKGARRGTPSGNPLGKNPSDFWTVVQSDWDTGIWNIPNVKANHPEKTFHPCQFPVELVQRCVLALSNEGDLVLDPFLGVGSAAIASLMHKRSFVGFELQADYLAEARRRVKAFQAGNLRLRPLGKPVYAPTGRERVAQMPIEWLKDSGGL